MFDPSIAMRGTNLSSSDRKKIRKALHDLHNLEIMAANIYRCQISKKNPDIREPLIGAMKNEMGHIEDDLVKLYEYGCHPVWFRWAFWCVGWVIGTFSKIGGRIMIFRAGIWTESKAIRHYEELIRSAPWDDETVRILKKDRDDEIMHRDFWNALLEGKKNPV